MARIENTTPGPKVLHDTLKSKDKDKDGNLIDLSGSTGQAFEIPRGSLGVGTNDHVKGNGVAEVPDDVLDRLMKNDPFTKGLFDSGALVVVSKGAAKTSEADKTETKTEHHKR